MIHIKSNITTPQLQTNENISTIITDVPPEDPIRKRATCQIIADFFKWLFWLKHSHHSQMDNHIAHSNQVDRDSTQINNNVFEGNDNHIPITLSNNNQTSHQEDPNHHELIGLESIFSSTQPHEI